MTFFFIVNKSKNIILKTPLHPQGILPSFKNIPRGKKKIDPMGEFLLSVFNQWLCF